MECPAGCSCEGLGGWAGGCPGSPAPGAPGEQAFLPPMIRCPQQPAGDGAACAVHPPAQARALRSAAEDWGGEVRSKAQGRKARGAVLGRWRFRTACTEADGLHTILSPTLESVQRGGPVLRSGVAQPLPRRCTCRSSFASTCHLPLHHLPPPCERRSGHPPFSAWTADNAATPPHAPATPWPPHPPP